MFIGNAVVTTSLACAIGIGGVICGAPAAEAERTTASTYIPATQTVTETSVSPSIDLRKKHRRVVKLTPRRRAAINHDLRRADRSLLTRSARKIVFKGAGKTGLRYRVAGRYPIFDFDVFPDDFFGDAWHVTKCAAAITIAVVPLSKSLRVIDDLGGIRSAAVLLVRAGSVQDFAQTAGYVAADVLGVGAVEAACF